MPFSKLGLSPKVVDGVRAAGYTDPTPIQLRAIPILMEGRDLIGSAQTGTGKTAAFALPLISRLGQRGALRALILEPTRELAAQVETAIRDYGRFTNLRTIVLYGGTGYGKQDRHYGAAPTSSWQRRAVCLTRLAAACCDSTKLKYSFWTKPIECWTWDLCPTSAR